MRDRLKTNKDMANLVDRKNADVNSMADQGKLKY